LNVTQHVLLKNKGNLPLFEYGSNEVENCTNWDGIVLQLEGSKLLTDKFLPFKCQINNAGTTSLFVHALSYDALITGNNWRDLRYFSSKLNPSRFGLCSIFSPSYYTKILVISNTDESHVSSFECLLYFTININENNIPIGSRSCMGIRSTNNSSI